MMNRVFIDKVLPLFDRVYYKFPSAYLPMYFAYKRISEADTVNFAASWLKEGDVVFDIGANVGFYTRLFSRLVGESGEVYAFEPDQTNFNTLKKVCKNCKNTILERKAVSNKNGNLYLYRSKERNTDHQTFDIGEGRSAVKVASVALDERFSKKKVNLIKIDVQGYDYFALLGLREVIKNSERLALIGEIWPYALNKLGINPKKYIKLINDLGMKFNEREIDFSRIQKELSNPYYYVDFIATKI